MPESFFRRWARRKADNAQSHAGAGHLPASATDAGDAPAGARPAQPDLPSMKDVALLAADADFSPFLAKGVDQAVRRAAMKKLFSDPHFNVMDGLDIYIDNYTKPSPLPPGMLEKLQHAKSTLEPKRLYETPTDDDSPQDVTAQDAGREAGDADDADEADAPDDAGGAGEEPIHDAPEQQHEPETAIMAEAEDAEPGTGAQDTAEPDLQACSACLPAQQLPINITEYTRP